MEPKGALSRTREEEVKEPRGGWEQKARTEECGEVQAEERAVFATCHLSRKRNYSALHLWRCVWALLERLRAAGGINRARLSQLCSMSLGRQLENSHTGNTYTIKLGKCFKPGLFFLSAAYCILSGAPLVCPAHLVGGLWLCCEDGHVRGCEYFK